MAIFRRKLRPVEHQATGRHAAPEPADRPEPADQLVDQEVHDIPARRLTGPFDITEAPSDGLPRLDFGSVRIPVPDDLGIQIQRDPATNEVQAVNLITPHGQVTISAYAAPRSEGMWDQFVPELTQRLEADGAKVASGRGEWGAELSAIIGDTAVRFVGVDGPRWLLRGVIAGPQSQAAAAPAVLRDMMRHTIVDRGTAPMPARSPLPIILPASITEHLAAQQAEA